MSGYGDTNHDYQASWSPWTLIINGIVGRFRRAKYSSDDLPTILEVHNGHKVVGIGSPKYATFVGRTLPGRLSISIAKGEETRESLSVVASGPTDLS